MAGAGHFERVARTYAAARPPYPAALFDRLADHGAVGDGKRVLEIGAGTGQATAELLARGCDVTAVEPGAELAQQLRANAPRAGVRTGRVEDLQLRAANFDTVAAATALHWVDLPTGLPRLHASLRPGGLLAAWRTIYGDPRVATPFRAAVHEIVARRAAPAQQPAPEPLDPRPTEAELVASGWFVPVERWTHAWSIDLSPAQLHRLFATFSDWSPDEVAEVGAAAEQLGPVITEHYVTHLRLLRRADR